VPQLRQAVRQHPVITTVAALVFLFLFFMWLWTMAFTHGSGGLDIVTTYKR
jgi:hypothetical protein